MIPRYSRPDMVALWSPETRFRIWFEIEAHAADAMAKLGLIPKTAAKKIWDKGGKATFDIDRIDEIERETKHDVIAFLTHLAEIVGPEARFVHSGMTSSDVLDTCLNVQLTRAADILIADVDKLLAAIRKRAFEHKMTPTIGRSHGIHAEPTTFGLKLAGHYAEFARNLERLRAAPTAYGLVSGLGWYMTKHAALLLSATPPARPTVSVTSTRSGRSSASPTSSTPRPRARRRARASPTRASTAWRSPRRHDRPARTGCSIGWSRNRAMSARWQRRWATIWKLGWTRARSIIGAAPIRWRTIPSRRQASASRSVASSVRGWGG